MKNNLIAGALVSLFLVSSSYAAESRKCFKLNKSLEMVNLTLGINRKTRADYGATRDEALAKLKAEKAKFMNMACSLTGSVNSGSSDKDLNYLYVLGRCSGAIDRKATNLVAAATHIIDFNFSCILDPDAKGNYNLIDGKVSTGDALKNPKIVGCTHPADEDGKPIYINKKIIGDYHVYTGKKEGDNWVKVNELFYNGIGSSFLDPLHAYEYKEGFGESDGETAVEKVKFQVKSIDPNKISITADFVPSDQGLKKYYIENVGTNVPVTLTEPNDKDECK